MPDQWNKADLNAAYVCPRGRRHPIPIFIRDSMNLPVRVMRPVFPAAGVALIHILRVNDGLKLLLVKMDRCLRKVWQTTDMIVMKMCNRNVAYFTGIKPQALYLLRPIIARA